MVEFVTDAAGVELNYAADRPGNGWVWRELRDHGEVTISRIFTFEASDLLDDPGLRGDEGDYDGFVYRFRFAARVGDYLEVPGRIFDIPNPVMIAAGGVALERKTFAAERDISILRAIARQVAPGQPIVIGGSRPDAIPVPDYETLLRKFPNTGEMNRYAAARVATIVGDYIQPLKDACEQYEIYLTRRRSSVPDRPLNQLAVMQAEIDKYIFIRDTVTEWLTNGASRSEGDWQKMIVNFLLLIFPKYVTVLSNVKIADAYSAPGKITDRFIDLALVDAGGSIDVIEVKKPFDDALLARRPYRDNYIPAKELAGGIMQTEKYLFHLSKWGLAGEKALSGRYKDQLPPGMTIRITNPKAMMILGRDRRADGTPALAADQALDMEIIRRKYANMIDVMTYDDLLRRLENIIAALRGRAADMGGAVVPPSA